MAISAVFTVCHPPKRGIEVQSNAADSAQPRPAIDSQPLDSSLRFDSSHIAGPPNGKLAVNPDVGPIPLPIGSGAYVVSGACPGEGCSYGQWSLARGVTLRRQPTRTADSSGYVFASRQVCADSGFIVVDPPGVVVITRPPPKPDYAVYLPQYEPGDTVLVFYHAGEGYWIVQRRDSLTLSLEVWDSTGSDGARLVREPRNFWWVHLTDRASGSRGWALSEDLPWDNDERPLPCR